MSAAPTTLPTTIPAMAPALRPPEDALGGGGGGGLLLGGLLLGSVVLLMVFCVHMSKDNPHTEQQICQNAVAGDL
jgi:hypothetical protein